jgi:hypothetical protein
MPTVRYSPKLMRKRIRKRLPPEQKREYYRTTEHTLKHLKHYDYRSGAAASHTSNHSDI